MNTIYGYAGACLFAAGLATPAAALTDAQFQAMARDAMAPIIAEYDVPGMAVGVVWQGREYIFTTGVADRAAGTPVTEDTLFELGSISKIFNATLAALAQGQGRLALADPVAARLPDLQGRDFGALTVMDLATHQTGGMPLQVPDQVTDDAALTDWLKGWTPEGSGLRSYSNISTGVLGRIAASAYGTTYADALRTNLLAPLGLSDTHVTVPDDRMATYAWGYRDDQAVRVNPGMLDAEAYGLKSDLGDLLAFLRQSLGDTDAPQPLRDAIALTHAGQTRNANFTQAMIWERYPWPVPRDQLLAGNAPQVAMESQRSTPLDQPDTTKSGTLFSKTGSTNGFGGYVAFIPDEGLGLVILANRNVPLQDRVGAGLTLIETVLETEQ